TVSSPYEGRSGDVSPGVDGPPVMSKDSYAYVVAEFQALPPPDYEEDPSGDDADEEDEEQDEDDDDEEEEHPALANSIPPPPALCVTARISFRPQPPTLSFTKEDAERFLAMPIPPPSPLTSLSSQLPQIPSPLLSASPPILPIPLPAASPPTASPPLQLLSSDHRVDRPEAMIDQGVTAALAARGALRSTNGDGSHNSETGVRRTERAIRECTYTEFLKCQPLPFKGTKGVASLSQWCERMESDIYGVMEDTQGRQTEIFQRVEALMEDTQGRQTKIFQRVKALVDDSQYHYETGRLGHLATALGEIRALQAREHARAGALEGASSST
nr:hypothetical protein [Tanacetum cinerariifolium]